MKTAVLGLAATLLFALSNQSQSLFLSESEEDRRSDVIEEELDEVLQGTHGFILGFQ